MHLPPTGDTWIQRSRPFPMADLSILRANGTLVGQDAAVVSVF